MATGDALDLSGYVPVFSEEWQTARWSTWGPYSANSVWISHTPKAQDNAGFAPNGSGTAPADFPRDLVADGLRMRASAAYGGQYPWTDWKCAILCSMDSGGNGHNGFKFRRGYVEFSMKLHPTANQLGIWPAAWLLGYDGSDIGHEIDVFEQYGFQPNQFRSNWHHWVPGNNVHGGEVIHTPPSGTLGGQFFRYGLEILDDTMIWYLDGLEIRRDSVANGMPASLFNVDYALLIDLAIQDYRVEVTTEDPLYTYCKYIRVWEPATQHANRAARSYTGAKFATLRGTVDDKFNAIADLLEEAYYGDRDANGVLDKTSGWLGGVTSRKFLGYTGDIWATALGTAGAKATFDALHGHIWRMYAAALKEEDDALGAGANGVPAATAELAALSTFKSAHANAFYELHNAFKAQGLTVAVV